MRARRLTVLALPLMLAAGLAGCTSPDPTPVPATSTAAGVPDGTFSALLARLPDTAAGGKEEAVVVYGDLDRATLGAGLTRPTDASDADAVLDWLSPLTGVPRDGEPPVHAVRLADSFSPNRLSQVTEFDQEVGWSVVDVHQFVEVQSPPQNFLLATADDLTADLDATQGAAVNGIWGAAGEDFRVDIAQSSAARPLGENIRVAQQDGLLAVSRATPPLAQWISGGATLADDPELTPIAAALDAAGVYTAMVVTGTDFSLIAALGPSGTPDLIKSLDDVDLPLPFTTAAAGLTTAEGKSTGTIVLSFPSAQAATDSLEPFSAGLTDGTNFRTGRPVADFLQLIDAEVDGNLIVATVGFEDSTPAVLFQTLQNRDIPFVHG